MSKLVEKKKKAVRFFKNKNKKSKKNCKTLLTLDFRCAIIPKSAKAGENLGVAQLVARYLGVVEAARSSRVTQTKQITFATGASETVPPKHAGIGGPFRHTRKICGYGGIGRRARFRF